jgi:hypothetical protein
MVFIYEGADSSSSCLTHSAMPYFRSGFTTQSPPEGDGGELQQLEGHQKYILQPLDHASTLERSLGSTTSVREAARQHRLVH